MGADNHLTENPNTLKRKVGEHETSDDNADAQKMCAHNAEDDAAVTNEANGSSPKNLQNGNDHIEDNDKDFGTGKEVENNQDVHDANADGNYKNPNMKSSHYAQQPRPNRALVQPRLVTPRPTHEAGTF